METKQWEFPLRVQGESEEGMFSGYASVFGNTDSHNDVIDHGAFRESITENGSGIKLLWQHQPTEPIGIITALKEDKNGLYVEGRLLLDVRRGREAWSLLKEKAINGLSIGFKAKDYYFDAQGKRHLSRIELYEISLVTFPANSAAGVMKVKEKLPATLREFEHFLRDAGFSRSEAKSIAMQGYSYQREAEVSDDAMLEASLERAFIALTNLTR